MLFGLATSPGFFTSLTKPIFFLCQCMCFCIIIYLDDNLVLIHLKCTGKRAQSFLSSILVCLGQCIVFSTLNFISLSVFIFWDYLGIQWICLSLPSNKTPLRYGSWFFPCWSQSLSSRLCLFGARPILCQWMCMTLLIVSHHSA